jgi:hypothetical protein
MEPDLQTQQLKVQQEKEKKMRKCYDYMNNLKSILSRDEYSQYLQYLKLLKENYMKEKIQFYATIAFQIFFPNSDKKCAFDNLEIRKQLYLHSKYFYPKTDREQYSVECEALIKGLEKKIEKIAEKTEKKIEKQQTIEKKGIKLQVGALIKYETKKMEQPEPKIEPAPKAESMKDQQQEETIICMICFEAYDGSKEFSKAKCGHVACNDCWMQWLANCLECPMCKQRTRAKQLSKL